MKTELEAKWLDVDVDRLRKKLLDLGARQEHPEILMKRKVFDFPDRRLEKIGAWIRVRDEGQKITLSYKQLNDRTLTGTKEATVIVNDFHQACEVLVDIGMIEKSYQETRRELWRLDGSEITIDSWPWIPTFVEIEAETEPQLRSTAARLGLEWTEAMHGSVETAYQKYYDVTDQEIDTWPQITFSIMPEGLEKRRRGNRERRPVRD
jgi:adenylate cyclase class 2